MPTTVHDLFPSPYDRTTQEKFQNAWVLDQLRQGPKTQEALRKKCTPLAPRITDVTRFLLEVEDKTIDRTTTKAHPYITTYAIRVCWPTELGVRSVLGRR